MSTRWRRRAAALSAILMAVLFTAPPMPAVADPSTNAADLQRQIDAQLAAHPGGKQLNASQISYANGAFIITMARPAGTAPNPDCPAGWFCFYEYTGFGYPRGQLSSCGWQDLAWWGWNDRVESVHSNQTRGKVTFLNHGLSPTHSDDVALFSITPGQARADVSPYRNIADHVYRTSC